MMPDRIQITHQPRTMTTPRTGLPPGPLSEDDLRRGWNQQADEHNQWESLDSCEQLAWAQARAIAADRALSQPSAETFATGALTDIQLWELLPKRLEQNLLAMVQLAAAHHNLKPIDLLQEIAPDFVDYARAVLASDRARRIARDVGPEGEGPSLADVDGLCAEFGFHYDDDDGESLEMLHHMITAAFARWGHPPAAAPAPVPTYLDAIRLAQGCHDYSGGHSGAESEAWHGAIDTVVDVLKRAEIRPWDSQTMAVFGVGVEAQAQPVTELDDQHRAAVRQAVAEALGSGAYDCTRVWEAWQVGTMGEDDFVLVAEDPDRVAEIADAAIEAIRAIPAPQAGKVEA